MNLENISSILISSGLFFGSMGVLKEMKEVDKYSKCTRYNLNTASTLLATGSVLSIYKLIRPT